MGRISTGAANDLERATKLAYAMVVYYGMSDRIPNISYYDSTGQDYGFSKPYGEQRAKEIDEEVSRIINEQYSRAKKMLSELAKGHRELADVLLSREVIYTEDVERIFGKRQWASRTDEILAAQENGKTADKPRDSAAGKENTTAGKDDGRDIEDVEAVEVKEPETPNEGKPDNMPPIPQK